MKKETEHDKIVWTVVKNECKIIEKYPFKFDFNEKSDIEFKIKNKIFIVRRIK